MEKKPEKLRCALASSEICYRRLFESSKDGKIIIDAKTGVILESNPSFDRMICLSHDKIVGKELVSFAFFREMATEFSSFLNLFQHEYAYFEDIMLLSCGGKAINADIAAHIYSVKRQKLVYINIRDASGREKAKRQFRLLSKAIEQSPATVVITDKQGKIEYVNPKFTEVSGYTMDEVRGENPRLGQVGAHPKEFYQNLWNTILGGKDWKGEFHNRKKSGESFWEHAVISPITDSDRNISHFIAVKEDITEKKKIFEELIKAKEKAEESDRLKSAFLANMSHEIRTPMNGILGFAELLKDPKLTTEELREFIDVIEESGKRMLNIINEIVEISKIESGVMNINLKETNINDQIDFIHNLFKPDTVKKGLKLSICKGLPYHESVILTDPEKLYAVLMNLVKNAIKFTENGFIELGYEKKNSYIEFYVKDSGIGIPEDKLQDIFNRFVQADMEGYKRPYEGAGLGLAISKAYVEMLKGRIWVVSEAGKGSEFRFTVPVKSSQQIPVNLMQDSELKEEPGKLKVLIVEDDIFSSRFLQKVIKKYSSDLLIARNGIEAVQICRKEPDIDLILMDIQMPEMDGYEATRQIRKFNKVVIIIAQTAFVYSYDRDRALEIGCNEYISKPVEKKMLTDLIKKFFDYPVLTP